MVSSANRWTLDLMFCGRSFMSARKSIGPMTEPWGAPERTATKLDFSPSTTKHCCRFSRKALIRFRVSPEYHNSPVYKEDCKTGFATNFEFIFVIVVDFSVWLYVIPGPVQLRCSCSSRQNSFHRRNCAYHLRLYFVRWGNQTGNTTLYIMMASILAGDSLTFKKKRWLMGCLPFDRKFRKFRMEGKW